MEEIPEKVYTPKPHVRTALKLLRLLWRDLAAWRVREAFGVWVDRFSRRWRHEVPDLDWRRVEKYYDADQVRAVLGALEACQPAEGGAPWRGVGVQSVTEHGGYQFGCRRGRSVTLLPG